MNNGTQQRVNTDDTGSASRPATGLLSRLAHIPNPKPWVAYVAAVVATALAAALRWWLGRLVGSSLPPFITFYPVPILAALLGGAGPGLLATGLNALAVAFIFLPPTGSLAVASPADQIGLALFCAINIAITVISAALRAARHRTFAEARRAEASEVRYRRLFEASHDGVLLLDTRSHKIVDANPFLTQILGYTRDEILGKEFWQIGLLKDVPASRAAFDQLATQGYIRYDDLPLLAKTGETREVEFVSNVYDEGGRSVIQCNIRDITERKQAEDALRKSERHFRALADSVPQLVWTTDSDGRVDYISQQWTSLTGLPPEAALDYGWSTLVHPEDQPRTLQNWAAAASAGQPYENEHRLRTSGGRYRWFLARAAPLRDSAGHIERWFGTCIDITERKQNEEALRKSREIFRIALGAGRMGTWIWDLSTGKVMTDALHRRLWDLEDSESLVPVDLILSRIHPDDLGKVVTPDRACSVTGPFDFEIRIRRRDGQLRWLRSAGTPVPAPDGTLNTIVGVNFDITERKQAEAALRQQEKLLRTVLGLLPVGIWIFDVQGRLLQNNPAASTLWSSLRHPPASGYGEFRGRSAATGQPLQPADWPVARALTRAETVNHEEIHMEGRDGQPRFMLLSALPISSRDGTVTGAVLVSEDITERKRAEHAIQRHNQHLQLLHQASARLLVGQQPVKLLRELHSQIAQVLGADAFMLYQAEGSNGHLHLLACGGVTEEQQHKLETLRYGRAICARPEEALQPIIATEIQTRQAPNRRFVRKLGFRSYLYYPLILNNHVHGTVAFASRSRDDYDHTDLDFFHTIAGTLAEALERERLEFEIRRHATELESMVRERTAKLQETVAELENFSYTITHDMRAPLRAMQGFGGALLEECGECLNPTRRDYLRRIVDSADRMDRLITDALQFSGVVRQQFDLEPVDTGSLLRGIIESYPQFQAPHADIRIQGDLPVVLGNKAGLTQCFSNLLGNAVKFVQPESVPEVSVWAELRDVERRSVRASERQASEAEDAPTLPRSHTPTARIWFEDKGIGIEKEYHDKIWVMFQKLNKSYEGTGIGLTLVRKAVEKMGGRVGVESEPGRGSRFWVELRLAHS